MFCLQANINFVFQYPFLQVDVENKEQNTRFRRNVVKTCVEPYDNNHLQCCLWEFVVDIER